MSLSIGGLGSGIDTQTVVAQLMQAEAGPQNTLRTALGTTKVKAAAWTSLSSLVNALRTRATTLSSAPAVRTTTATSSQLTLVSATSTAAAPTGSVTFRVRQLATSDQLATGGLASSAALVGAGSMVVTSGAEAMGGATVALGATAPASTHHTLVVTDQARPATATVVPPADALDSGTLSVSVGGAAAVDLDLAGAPSDPLALRDLLNSRFTDAGLGVTARISGGALQLVSTATGSTASLQFSGTGATALGLPTAAVTGADRTVTADGAVVPLDTSGPTPTYTFDDGTTVTFAGEPRAGTLGIGIATLTDPLSTVSDLAAALTTAGGPASAALVDTGSGDAPYRLVLTATGTGTAGALTSTASFSGSATALGTTHLRTAQDAQIVLGDPAAPSPLVVSRSSNTVSDVVPGVTLTLLKADPATDVTVGVTRDDTAAAAKVKDLVTALNDVLSWVSTNTAYDVAGKKGGPMVGDSGVRGLASSLFSAVSGSAGTGAYRTPGSIGISTQRDGSYLLDETALADALRADPDAVGTMVAAVATSLAGVAKAAVGEGGAVRVGTDGNASDARDLQTRIDDWDVKLAAIQARYQRQFSALDVALGTMNSQQRWLTQQIAALPSSS